MSNIILNNIINDDLNEEDFDNELILEFNKIKYNKKNNKDILIKSKKNNNLNEEIDLLVNRSNLIEHLENKIIDLEQKIRLIELKNNKYKRCYNSFNIGIIFLSTLLTSIESSKAVLIDENNLEFDKINKFAKLCPIFLGSLITFGASILKFKKYQEKMEQIVKLIERGNSIIGNIQKIKEELIFCKENSIYDKIEEKYKADSYDIYINVLQEIERVLKDSDYDKYLEQTHYTDFNRHVLEQTRKSFFKNYEPDEEFNINLKKKRNKHNYCISI